jgi:hypothetical protein
MHHNASHPSRAPRPGREPKEDPTVHGARPESPRAFGNRVDAFQPDRSPTHAYRTAPLRGLWTHQKGGFYQRRPLRDAPGLAGLRSEGKSRSASQAAEPWLAPSASGSASPPRWAPRPSHQPLLDREPTAAQDGSQWEVALRPPMSHGEGAQGAALILRAMREQPEAPADPLALFVYGSDLSVARDGFMIVMDMNDAPSFGAAYAVAAEKIVRARRAGDEADRRLSPS